ncbi:class II aldolase/adducin family protein [Marinilabilia salmonicolor]|uniref:Rhamnose utilization protein RhaD (Predicted bifunctional aldolase and dehydrogenase) n=1 Tax=Marinilabilia salmonicolor TaxID=989 RepID=A0A368V0K9_9BACT|nr:class II aldolase/adducin family protein [Marinilabilia salmonicolor]RCW32541.1 rhamnose utilization protein RhaD (predicted bifunctional aldolase and dehydrogenase) [Marinilabilia salmonicolor]
MQKELEALINISRKYGQGKNFTIAGGGNTSFKTEKELWVKASGYRLGDITRDGFVRMDRKLLNVISYKQYSEETFLREREVKEDLEMACLEKGKRPSVETSLHNAIEFAYVVHMHPFLINAVLCSNRAEKSVMELWGQDVLYIPYSDPGYVLFKKVEAEISGFKYQKGFSPKVILMQNHGVFVGANTIEEIEQLYGNMMTDILKFVPQEYQSLSFQEFSFDPSGNFHVPEEYLKLAGLTFQARNNALISQFAKNDSAFRSISIPFTPDVIVYCKSSYLFLEKRILHNPNEIVRSISEFHKRNGYYPKVLILEEMGLVSLAESEKSLQNILDVFEDQMKIAWFSRVFGGSHPMEAHQIEFIDSWEVENYRRTIST